MAIMKNKPLYQDVFDTISGEIGAGKIAPGEKLPSVRELCHRFHVSHITIMRACRELASAGIIVSRGTLGFFAAEYGNYSSQTRRIAIVLRPVQKSTLFEDYFNRIHGGIQSCALRNDYTLIQPPETRMLDRMLLTREEENQLLQKAVLLQQEADGIFLDERISDAAIEPFLKDFIKPAVIVNRSTSLPLAAVPPPNREGMHKLLAFTRRLGYDIWVYVSVNLLYRNELERKQAFDVFMEKEHLKNDVLDGCAVMPLETIRERLQLLLQKYKGKKILFIAPSDYVGRTIADLLAEEKTVFGREVGIVSFEGLGVAKQTHPYLTTLSYSPEDLGRLAFQKLFCRISDTRPRNVSDNETLPFQIEMGETI